MSEVPFHRPVIAITGSAGKSTTKEMLSSILRRQWKIVETHGDRNVMRNTREHQETFKDPTYQAAVLEYGMGTAGQIAQHCKYMQPDFAAITGVGTAHIGNFGGDINRVAAAKSEIIHGMNPYGILFLNLDNPGTKLLETSSFPGRIVTVGVEQPADYQGYDVTFGRGGMLFSVKLRGRAQRFYIPIYGRHHVCNALLAIAMADRLGFSYADIWQGLQQQWRPWGRLTVTQHIDNITVINDSYSANPTAVKAALDVLREVAKGRAIAVLGDMLELGAYTDSGHAEVGEHLADQGIDYLVTYGDIAQRIGDAAIAKGFPQDRVFHFAIANRDQLHQHLEQLTTPGSTVLLKASNALELWRTYKHLAEILRKSRG